MSKSYCVVYYCYGNASPKDANHNPIPSICTLRKYNKTVPIVIMYAENNKDFFIPYQQILNYDLHKFSTRSDNTIHQMVYRPNDIFTYLMGSGYDYCIYCDTDVMWHKDCDDFFYDCLQSHKQFWFCENFNGGLHGIGRQINIDLIKCWHAIGHLLHTYQNSDAVKILLTDSKHGFIHDESAMAILRQVLKNKLTDIYYYPDGDIYTPYKDGPAMLLSVVGVHYLNSLINRYVTYTFSNHTFNIVGRTGVMLSINEYKNAIKETLGVEYPRFIKGFTCLSEQYDVETFVKQWREYVQLH